MTRYEKYLRFGFRIPGKMNSEECKKLGSEEPFEIDTI
jgi:hypothetical protein